MIAFWTLGQAVAGIFITVTLSGILAGIVGYGALEQWRRGPTQRRVVERLLQFIDVDGDDAIWMKEWEAGRRDGYSSDPNYSVFARHVFKDVPDRADWLAIVLEFDPNDFYRLPYRQLCGQLAGRVSAETAAAASKAPSTGLTWFLDFHLRRNGGFSPYYRYRPDYYKYQYSRGEIPAEMRFQDGAERVLHWVDTLQIRLAEANAHVATFTAGYTLALIYFALLLPFAGSLTAIVNGSSMVVAALGTVVFSVVAVLVLIMLAFGSLIIAALTFRWIDRVASPR